MIKSRPEWRDKLEQMETLANQSSYKNSLPRVPDSIVKKTHYETGKRFEETLHYRKHADAKYAHEQMCNIIKHQGNIN